MIRIAYIFLICIFLYACGGSKKIVSSNYEALNNPRLSPKENQKIRQLFFEGIREYYIQNFDRAEASFATIVKIDKGHASSWYYLALINEQQKDYELALNYIQIATTLDPDNQWYKLFLGKMYEYNAKYNEAAKVYQSIVEKNPKNLDVYYYWMNTLGAQGKWQEMIEVMNKIENETGFSEELTMEREKLYLRSGDVDGAISEVQKIIEKDPKNPKYLNLLAELYQKKGDSEKALEIFNKILKINPNDPYVHLSLSEYYKNLGDEQEAAKQIQLAFKSTELGIDPKVRILLDYFTLEGLKKDKEQEAYNLGKIITEVHHTEAKAHSVFGDLLYRLDSNKLALQHYKKAVEFDNSKFVLWSQILILESELKDFKSMEVDAERAIELFPSQPSFYLFKGIALVQKKKYDEGIAALKTGIDLVYDNNALMTQFYSTLGDAFYKKGDHSASDEAFEKALEYDPNNVYVLNNYSYYLSLRKENLDKAAEMSKKSNELSPRTPSFADTYGWILFQQGKYEDAKFWIENAIEFGAKNNGVILEHYGDVLYKLGNIEGAKQQWQKAKETKQGSDLLDEKLKTGEFIE